MNKFNTLVLMILLMGTSSGSVVCMDIFDAVRNGNIKRIMELIAAGANLNAWDEGCLTPLHEAACYGYQEVVKALIDAGANIKIKDQDGKTPLCIANERGHRAIVAGITGYQRQVPVIAGTLAQSLHRRLGAESPVGLLPQHLVKNISRLSAAALCFERN